VIFSLFVFGLCVAFAASAAMLCDEAVRHFDRGDVDILVLALVVSSLGAGIAVLFLIYILAHA